MLDASDAICFSTFWSAALPNGGASANSSLSFWILCSTVVSWHCIAVCVPIALFSFSALKKSDLLMALAVHSHVMANTIPPHEPWNGRSNRSTSDALMYLRMRACLFPYTRKFLLQGSGEETVDDCDAVRQKQAKRDACDARGQAEARVAFHGSLAE